MKDAEFDNLTYPKPTPWGQRPVLLKCIFTMKSAFVPYMNSPSTVVYYAQALLENPKTSPAENVVLKPSSFPTTKPFEEKLLWPAPADTPTLNIARKITATNTKFPTQTLKITRPISTACFLLVCNAWWKGYVLKYQRNLQQKPWDLSGVA